VLERPGDASLRHFRRGERLGRAQHDQVLEREQIGIAGPAGRGDEPGVDQALDGAARKAKQPLDVADAVRMGCGRFGGGDYFLAAFLGADSACWTRLGALRGSGSPAALAGAGDFFLSRLARSASSGR